MPNVTPSRRDLDHLGQHAHQLVVVVPQHGVHRGEAGQLVEHVGHQDVARVEDDVGPLEVGVGGVGQPAGPTPADVGVGEDDDMAHGAYLAVAGR